MTYMGRSVSVDPSSVHQHVPVCGQRPAHSPSLDKHQESPTTSATFCPHQLQSEIVFNM